MASHLFEMPLTSWPSTAELDSRLSGLGVASFPAGLDKQRCIDAAVDMLEQVSGQKPFLIEAAAADWSFDPSRRDEIVLNGRWPEIDSVTLDGGTLTLGEQYWLQPYGGPYTSVKFLTPFTGLPQSLVVNGKQGYADEIPPTAWEAVLDYACVRPVRAAVQAGTITPGGVSEIDQGTVKLKFGTSSGSSASMTLDQQLEQGALKVFAGFRSFRAGRA